MLQFIVLGFIPGTNFQITFPFLVNLLAVSVAVPLLYRDVQWLRHFLAGKLPKFDFRNPFRITVRSE